MSDSGLHAAAVERLYLESDRHQALKKQEFFLACQPALDLRPPQMVGVETLVRWQSPTRVLVLPGDFIALPEETGTIVQIGQWVLNTAIAQLAAWDAEMSPRISG